MFNQSLHVCSRMTRCIWCVLNKQALYANCCLGRRAHLLGLGVLYLNRAADESFIFHCASAEAQRKNARQPFVTQNVAAAAACESRFIVFSSIWHFGSYLVRKTIIAQAAMKTQLLVGMQINVDDAGEFLLCRKSRGRFLYL